MQAQHLFALLALGFTLAAMVRGWRRRQLDPALRTWVVLAGLFAFTSAWLHWQAA